MVVKNLLSSVALYGSCDQGLIDSSPCCDKVLWCIMLYMYSVLHVLVHLQEQLIRVSFTSVMINLLYCSLYSASAYRLEVVEGALCPVGRTALSGFGEVSVQYLLENTVVSIH